MVWSCPFPQRLLVSWCRYHQSSLVIFCPSNVGGGADLAVRVAVRLVNGHSFVLLLSPAHPARTGCPLPGLGSGPSPRNGRKRKPVVRPSCGCAAPRCAGCLGAMP